MENNSIEEGDNNREVSPALIAVHPLDKFIAVAIGSDLRIFDTTEDCAISLLDDSGGSLHSDSIRAIRFGANGRLFVSAGDDKLVKLWTTSPWNCMRTVSSEKRVSAVAISQDGLFVCYADKFGVVWVVSTDGNSDVASPIFAHYCSIITSLEFSPDGRFIVSADRDFKIRVTLFPQKPFSGAHEIQSFCLGHTEFVTCLTFVNPPEEPQGFLLSGSGDATVRMWDIKSGSLVDTCEVGLEAGLLESNGNEETLSPAVTDIRATPDGSIIAVAIQGLHGVVLLSCDFPSRTLSITKVVTMKESFSPTSLGMGISPERLWMVTGASNLPNSESSSFTRIRVITGLIGSPVVLEDSVIPGGLKLLEKLQGSVSCDKGEAALAAAAEAVKTAMRNLLIKRQYSVEKRELRKKSRNDKKLKG
ncbi:hypothetical protein ACHQM5_014731 [Ranunculus cassubicifolius]